MTFTIPKDELEVALEGASMENKTLIIAVANKAYTEEGSFLALLLQSFQVGEVKKRDLSTSDISAQYKYKNTTIDVKVDTDSNISTTLTV
ncbi:hypothetical protein MRB53_027145 [Persea americana]|uniref:Uncharacterized protein n=1 Tax=Persea americana TaxID=3435 RepID=A0ACC2LL82_PERAE|nr:hypothetical protein MRB53_027145 [Persea americana]